MKSCALGIDFGTNSCRALVIDLRAGTELGSAVFNYPSGEMGILLDAKDPNLARQNPQDYIEGLAASVTGALAMAQQSDASFDPSIVAGIGVDTTGSTPIPVDAAGVPLALHADFSRNLAAQVWLWKDHTAHAEAAEITELARKMRPHFLARCGGIYSSEWWWSKILKLKRSAPDVFAAAHSFVEHCDWIPALLTGNTRPDSIKRGICAAGHKAMFNPAWGGLPDKEFLAALDPDLAPLRDRLYDTACTADQPAGALNAEWAAKLGLREGIPVAVGAFDVHMGAVAAGIRESVLVKVLGTSTCDVMVARNSAPLPDIPGLCGIVDGSILPGFFGLEAGQSAVGDIFLWFVNQLVPENYGRTQEEKFRNLEKCLSELKPGESGLLALDWNNGNRTILVDARLSGLLLGQTLHTTPPEIYRALIEATAFGALTIINRFEEYGVAVREVITTGGLAVKNAALMQIYADVLGRPMKVARSDQTCALGAAMFGAVAGGVFQTIEAAQTALCAVRSKVFHPNPDHQLIYDRLYHLYRTLHDAFGTMDWSGRLNHVMKNLIAVRAATRI
ncbi:MAG: ribulokinase [Verrucomicrobiales bacterium]